MDLRLSQGNQGQDRRDRNPPLISAQHHHEIAGFEMQCNAMQGKAAEQCARNLNCIALLNHNSAAVAFSQIRDQADRRQKLKWLHYRDTLRPRYVCTKSNLAFSTNLMLSTNPLVFSTKSNLHQMAPTTPSQTAFFTFFLCIFNLSRAILGAVWINLILPQNGGPAYKSSTQPRRCAIKF